MLRGRMFYLPFMENAASIPGYKHYSITRSGEVYLGDRRIKPIQSKGGKSARIKLRVAGKVIAIAVPKLVAMTHVPNLDHHTHIILIDRNKDNCHADNIRWVSVADSIRYNQRRIDVEGLCNQPSCEEDNADITTAVPIPGYENYRVTPIGKVYCGQNRVYASQGAGNRAARVKLRNAEGKSIRITIAKLVAITFIPNPNNYEHVIFIDRDNTNCCVENLRWVLQNDYIRFIKRCAESDELLGIVHRPKREPDWIDPERVPMEGAPGYYITRAGVVYKEDRIVKPIIKKNKSLKVRVHIGNQCKYWGLAKLIAEHFIPNPKHLEYVIFKDRNNHNCHADNVAWVDAETFIYYCGIIGGMQKIVLTREDAIKQCRNIYLRNYYETLDERWLEDCWMEVENRMKDVRDWDDCRSECYLYFRDRAQRFSITKDPVGLVVASLKGVRCKLKKEISFDMPNRVVWQNDESLREVVFYKDFYY